MHLKSSAPRSLALSSPQKLAQLSVVAESNKSHKTAKVDTLVNSYVPYVNEFADLEDAAVEACLPHVVPQVTCLMTCSAMRSGIGSTSSHIGIGRASSMRRRPVVTPSGLGRSRSDRPGQTLRDIVTS